MKKIILLSVLSFVALTVLHGQSQYKSKYPDIPIVDVNFHPREPGHVTNAIKVSDAIKQKYGSNLAFWIGLDEVAEPAAMKVAAKNRILFAVNAGNAHLGFRMGGLTYTADEVIEKVEDGYVGLNFWFGGPYRFVAGGEAGIKKIDDARLTQYFSKLEKANVLMTSLHIADPNPSYTDRQGLKPQTSATLGRVQSSMAGDTVMYDPVYFWGQIMAFKNLLDKYPKLTVVAAHGAWLVCQEAQLDYLRYLLSACPNLYIDISATCQYMHLLNRDNIRDFYIEYQDRLIFGTNGGAVDNQSIESYADRYARFFALLETDQVVNGGFFGNMPTKGLDLPKAVLEKIYYKNAVIVYPGLKEAMGIQWQLLYSL